MLTKKIERDLEELKNYKIGVLKGGISEERKISLISGREVFLALKRKGLDAEEIEINTSDEHTIEEILLANNIEIAFIALHGEFGEDGQIQKILEGIDIPYTGSGPEASYLAMDKIASKRLFLENNVLTPDFYIIHKDKVASPLSFPKVIKPYYSGSSIGVFIVDDIKAWDKSINKAFEISDRLIIEEYIRGREITVGILDDKPLSVIEIVPKEGYFDFTTKYSDALAEFKAPAPLNKDTYKKVMEMAERAHRCLGCRHFSRVDIRLDNYNNPFVLEVNSIPGLTSHSLLPLSAKVCGIDFDNLIMRMLISALKNEKKAKQKV